MKELWHDTLVFTLLKMLMGDGLLTIHHTLPKPKRNLINAHYRYHQLYPYQQTDMSCHRTGMVTLSTSSYSSITKAILEYSYGLSFNIEICCGLPYLRTGAIHDKTNRETCQSWTKAAYKGCGIPSGPLQDLLQHTGIPWIANQNICCMWCQFCRWPTYMEKSSRTLDFLPADLLNGKATGNER